MIGFSAWREGLVARARRRGPAIGGVADVVRRGLRLVNREPGAEARRVLDRELGRAGIDGDQVAGYQTMAAGHLQVADAIAAGLADAGVACEPAALAYGLAFIPLAAERFDLVIPAEHADLTGGAGADQGARLALADRPAGQPAWLRPVVLRPALATLAAQ